MHLNQGYTSNPQCFWGIINKLGPRQTMTVPMEVLSLDGTVIYEKSLVMKKWEDEFKGLFTPDENEFNDIFYRDVCSIKGQIENDISKLGNQYNYLNDEIKLEEVQCAVSKAKVGKATGTE